MRLRKKLLVIVMMLTIALPLAAYAWTEIDRGGRAEENQEKPSDVTKFSAIVNGMRNVDVFVCVNLTDGLTENEAELIVGTTFILVMGDYVTDRLDSLVFDDAQITAHYTWGYDENDMGHVFDMAVDLTTLQITVNHCF
jgi:hypothetical protein